MNKVIKIEILTIQYKAKKAIEKERGCKYIRINPDEQIFNIFETINTKIHWKSTKKLLINNLSKRFLELKFKSNHSIKLKREKILPSL